MKMLYYLDLKPNQDEELCVYIYIYKGGILFNRTTSKITQEFRIVMSTNSFNFMRSRMSFTSFCNKNYFGK